MIMQTLDLDTVVLLPHQLFMKESVDLTLYTITQWSLVHRNGTNNKDGVKMTITLQRKLMNELMTTYLPSVLLMLITWATTFFKPYFFEAALSVNLTTMLVMTTIFISVMQMLPATAYVKMVDVWLIFGQLVPFAEVVILTAMEYHREGDGSGEEEEPVTHTINHHGAPRVIQLDLYEGEGTSKVSQDEASHDAERIEHGTKDALYVLKTLGNTYLYSLIFTITIFISEKKVLPSLVVIFTFGYILLSVMFYFHLM